MIEINKTVEQIKARRSLSQEDFDKLLKCLELNKHDVNNKNIFQDYELKERYQNKDTGDLESKFAGMHYVTRLPNPVARLIINSAVSHVTGNPLDVSYSEGHDKLVEEIESVMITNKQQSLNAKVCRAMFAFREVAEIWYLDEEDKKIRCHIASPLYGDTLYPEIDRLGRMQSFAYSNTFTNEEGDEVEELVHYTAKETTVYQKTNKDWEIIGEPIPNIWGKIPVVYHNQDKADFEDVIPYIYRLGQSNSDLSESVRNTAYPDKILTGDFMGVTQTPGRGGLYQTNGDADIKIAESVQGSNLIELEGKTLEEAIYTYTQTPNLSQSNVLKIGNLSGEAIKRLYTPAILKVQTKREYLDPYFIRRYNVVKTMVAWDLNMNADDLTIEVKVVPYYPKDIDADIDRLIKMSAFMPKRYIVEEFKRLINPSIDVDEVMEWFKEDQDFDFGGSLMVETQEV